MTLHGKHIIADQTSAEEPGVFRAVDPATGDALEPVVTDKRLRWPDTLSEGPDGTIYVTASHIQDTNWYKPGAPASLPTALFSFRR